MKRNIIICLLLLFIRTEIVSQNLSTNIAKLVNVIPPSPEASSLIKFGNIPVQLFTGIPQIDIPLYNVKLGTLNIPIVLNYHSGGIKVNEIASRVGLGWALSAGGLITRQVRGKPDEETNGYLNRNIAPLTIPITNSLTDAQYTSLEALAYNIIDSDPDVFTYHFLGQSGNFFIDHNKKIRFFTDSDIKINVNDNWTSWTIIDETGTKFIFSAAEVTASSTNQEAQQEQFISSWYLSQICTPVGQNISFTYSPPYTIVQDQLLTEHDKYTTIGTIGYINPCYSCPDYNGQIEKVITRQDIFARKLEKIETENVKIVFESDVVRREDLSSDYPLKFIKIYETNENKIVKNYRFNYGYFEGGGGYQGFGSSMAGSLTKRLKLISIDDVTDNIKPMSYKFSYNTTPLPSRDSYALDHYGYYNGANFNKTLLPQTYALPSGIPYANREVNMLATDACVLDKIEYPSGGNTLFYYEANKGLVSESVKTPINITLTMVNEPASTERIQYFRVEEPQYINIYYKITHGNYPVEGEVGKFIITDSISNSEICQYSGSGELNYSIFLQAGTYCLKMIFPDIPESFVHGEVNYFSAPLIQTKMKGFGGIRIKKIVDFDPINNKSNVRKFEYPQTPLIAIDITNEHYLSAFKGIAVYNEICSPSYTGGSGIERNLVYPCTYNRRISVPSYSFGDYLGSNVAYNKVNILYGENGEYGFSESIFNFEPPTSGGSFPYPPAMVLPSRNGLLLYQKDYNKKKVLIREIKNTYLFDERYRELAVKVGFLFDNPYHDASNGGKAYDQISYVHYNIISERVRKVSTRVTDFDDSGKFVLSSIDSLYYDDVRHSQLTRAENYDSKGNKVLKRFKYPHDFVTQQPYVEMINRNIISPHIEQQTFKVMPNVSPTFLSSTKTNYIFFNNNNLILPQSLETKIKDTNSAADTRISFNFYDLHGNILEQQKTGDVKEVYLWGYNAQYPVAKIVGSDFTTVSSVVDTALIGSITRSSLSQQQIGNQLKAELNKLRTDSRTKSALTSTYTYAPLIGITSETDPTGRTTFYEYDSFGRLSVVKDEHGKILKKICYNYSGQQINCN